MMLNRFRKDRRGSAARWFALTAAVVALAAVAGAQGLSRLRRQDQAPMTVFAPPGEAARSVSAGVDMTPIGVIKPASETRPAP